MFLVNSNYKLFIESNTMLTEEEKLIVLGMDQFSGINSMLTDELIFKFNRILKSHTHQFSMQPTIFLQRPYNIKPVQRNFEYIQILFTGSNECGHWICMYYCNDIIHIYDSFNQNCL